MEFLGDPSNASAVDVIAFVRWDLFECPELLVLRLRRLILHRDF